MRPVHIIVSCEHAGNLIPNAYKHLFSGEEEILTTHKGWDPGALTIAKKIADYTQSRLFSTKVSRLLIDCNRSIDNSELFSVHSKVVHDSVKKALLDHYYLPYRKKVEDYIAVNIIERPVVHLSIHTFTPIWHGSERLVDVGLLFDDNRQLESQFCESWRAMASKYVPEILVMLNVPYHGADDGFTTYLRSKFTENRYLGIEIEINQKWIHTQELQGIVMGLYKALEESLNNYSITKFTSNENFS